MLVAALFFGALSYGGLVVNQRVPRELVEVLEALVILFAISARPLLERVGAEDPVIVALLFAAAAALRISVPYALAALGSSISERGGVICMALEGIMLVGALAYTLGAYFTGNALGRHRLRDARGPAHRVAARRGHRALSRRPDHHRPRHQPARGGPHALRARARVPLLFQLAARARPAGAAAGRRSRNCPPSARCSPRRSCWPRSRLVVLVQLLLFRTVFGLRLRAIGERPEAAATLGLSVKAYRFAGVLLCGALASLGGAWLASEQHSFTDGMTGGRGYIALAAMIVGKWNPVGAAAACLLFGAAEALQITLQGSAFPSELLQALPYLVTMLALAGFIGRAVAPRAVGVPYDPEEA